jgi:hypothetical protein
VIKKGSRQLMGAATCTFFHSIPAGCSKAEPVSSVAGQLMRTTRDADLGDIRLQVVYDNVPHSDGLRTDWGFACLGGGNMFQGNQAHQMIANTFGIFAQTGWLFGSYWPSLLAF